MADYSWMKLGNNPASDGILPSPVPPTPSTPVQFTPEELARQKAARDALTSAGKTIAGGAAAVGNAAGVGTLMSGMGTIDLTTAPARALGSVVDTGIDAVNAFGGNVPNLPVQATMRNGVFPGASAVAKEFLGGAAPVTTPAAVPTTAAAAKPAAAAPAMLPAAPVSDGLNKTTMSGTLQGNNPQPAAKPAPAPLTPIEQGIKQQMDYGNSLREQLLNAVQFGGHADNRSFRMHALGGAIANTVGSNNFASLQQAQAQSTATNATQLAMEQMRAAEQRHAVDTTASTQREQLSPTIVGMVPNTDPTTRMITPFVPIHGLAGRNASGSIVSMPFSGQSAMPAAPAPTEGAQGKDKHGNPAIFKGGKWVSAQ